MAAATTTSNNDDKDPRKKTQHNDDSDDDDDEDYDPDAKDAKDGDNDGDDDDDADDRMEDVVVEETSVLAPAQQRAVDQAFQELFGYPWGTSFQLPRKRTRRTAAASDEDAANDDNLLKGIDANKKRLLIQILGPVRAARVLQTGASTMRPVRRPRQSAIAKWSKDRPAPSTSNASSTLLQQQEPQYEAKLFAGRKIQVAVSAGSNNTKAKAKSGTSGAGTGAGNIDQVLQQIAGPSKITTVAKTSADWDSFKTETGLEAELEQKAQGKDAFLVKKDFLTRVDNRKFELEREERDRERAKRGK